MCDENVKFLFCYVILVDISGLEVTKFHCPVNEQ